MQQVKEIFQTEILIQVSDINYGGHLGNDRFLTLAQEARVRWLRSCGWKEINIGSSGCGLIVVEARIKFLKEAFLGQTLIAKLFLGELRKCRCSLTCILIEKESGQRVGEVITDVAFFNYESRKVQKAPLEISNLVASL